VGAMTDVRVSAVPFELRETLVAARKLLGLTVAEVGARVGVGCDAVVALEAGRGDLPLSVACAWAGALGFEFIPTLAPVKTDDLAAEYSPGGRPTAPVPGRSGRPPRRVPCVVPVEAPRWVSLRGVMSSEQRNAALSSVASRMR